MLRLLNKIWFNYKEYFVLIILLLVSLFLISKNDHNSVKNFKSFVFGSFSVVTSVISDIVLVSDIRSENERLRRINSELMLEVNKLREYGIENEELKNMLGFQDTFNLSLIPAKVISRSFSTLQETITINIGEKVGIKPGFPVVNGEGLIGVVYNIADDYAIVRTLRNINLKLVVRDQRSRFEGILRWNGDYLTVTNLPKTADIQLGDRIITSEMSSLINTPLPVGIVAEILNPEKGIFNDLIIKPIVDFVRVDNLFVLNRIQSKKKDQLELNYFIRK
jgi:rod shape-determining protein MreC